jgi:hypothetical protein
LLRRFAPSNLGTKVIYAFANRGPLCAFYSNHGSDLSHLLPQKPPSFSYSSPKSFPFLTHSAARIFRFYSHDPAAKSRSKDRLTPSKPFPVTTLSSVQKIHSARFSREVLQRFYCILLHSLPVNTKRFHWPLHVGFSAASAPSNGVTKRWFAWWD